MSLRSAGLHALPAVTIVLAAGSLALFMMPGLAELLVYDRERVLSGEVWRLLTGHAVHFSPSHLGFDLLVLTAAGAWLEQRDRRRYLLLLGLAAVASGLVFLAFMPEMARYGGLSGLASAAVVFLSLGEIRRAAPSRPLWVAVLLLFAAKTGYEIAIGRAVFAAPGATPFAVVPAAHLAGAAIAVTLSFAHRRVRLAA